jgi:hypothetical protein
MRFLTYLLIAAGLASGQDKPAETKPPDGAAASHEPWVAEVIPVKTLTGDSFDRLMTLLSVFGAQVKGSATLRTIVVYAPKDVVAQMRRVVEQLDQPGSEAAVGKNIDMTLTLLRCSTKAPVADAPVLPQDMDSVGKQLRNATQYKDIQLWDVVPMRVQEGKDTKETLRLPGAAGTPFTTSTITIHPEAVYRKDQGRYVRFAIVKLDLQLPYSSGPPTGFNYYNMGLQTSGDFMEGQKTVLGKISSTGDDEAIFAVITLKVLD